MIALLLNYLDYSIKTGESKIFWEREPINKANPGQAKVLESFLTGVLEKWSIGVLSKISRY
jgi:hypothetical protein